MTFEIQLLIFAFDMRRILFSHLTYRGERKTFFFFSVEYTHAVLIEALLSTEIVVAKKNTLTCVCVFFKCNWIWKV